MSDDMPSKDVQKADEFKTTRCRICGQPDLLEFLDLHSMPVANGFLEKEDLERPEPKYALGAVVCQTCWLVQLTRVLPPELMFSNYLYIPSTSSTMMLHFDGLAHTVSRKLRLQEGDLVMDIGSNDGTLLNAFRQRGFAVLGIDPAINLAHLARMKGVETISTLFSAKVANELRGQNRRPKVITATNVMAHVDNLHDFCEGIEILLERDGVLVVEFPYVLELLENNEFDTIYHEHLSYFSLSALVQLFKQFRLRIFDLSPTSVHGGSMRIFVAKEGYSHADSSELARFLKLEEERGLLQRQTYLKFATRVYENTRELIHCLESLKKKGKRVAGYGASAKGNVLLNFCQISTNLVEYVVDSIPYKHWRFTPGTHIPIYPEQRLETDHPDYALLLAWNFKEEIIAKQARFRARGGRFIIPIPKVTIQD